MEIREYQVTAVEKLREKLRAGFKRPLMALATGGGKSIIFGKIISNIIESGKQVLWLVHRRNLVKQMRDVLREHFNIEPGIIMAGVESDTKKPVQLCTIQTFIRRMGLDSTAYNRFVVDADVVLIDEGHRSCAKSYKDVIDLYEDKIIMGCTATPVRADGRGLGEVYDTIVNVASVYELTKAGYLAPARYFAPNHVDLDGVKTKMGDFIIKDLDGKVNTTKLVGDVVENWLNLAENRKSIVYGVNVAHSKALRDEFLNQGVAVEHLDARSNDKERDLVFEKMQRGDLTVICNVALYQEGLDVPDVSCIVMARPTKSMGLYRQCCGRGLRPWPGKMDCLARDTLILTDKGNVKIQNITLDHKVWDGVSFVKHGGAICKGIQETITYHGITATLNHEVMTNEGWKTFSEAAYRQLRIVKTGFSGEEIRFIENNYKKDRRKIIPSQGASRMRKVWKYIHDFISQCKEKAQYKGVSSLQPAFPAGCSKMGLPKSSSPTKQMHEPQRSALFRLWRAGNKVLFRFGSFRDCVDKAEHRNSTIKIISVGQDKQQRKLRIWKYKVDYWRGKYEQFKKDYGIIKTEIQQFQEVLSLCDVCRCNIGRIYKKWFDRRRNKYTVGDSLEQTQREVWDIHNAGALQRFTANGCLVHNCLILDHGNLIEMHGFLDWEIEWSLDGKEQAWKKPSREVTKKLVKCRACHQVFMGVSVCPDCGTPVKSFGKKIITVEAELEEIGAKQKNSMADKAQWYGMFRYHCHQKGFAEGWIAHKYRAKFGVWPVGLKYTAPIEPTGEFYNYMRFLNIKWAKSKKKPANG